MGLTEFADDMARAVSDARDGVSEAFFEPVLRLGVTGLARSGKTVFITSLVANLLQRGRLPMLRAAASDRIIAAVATPPEDRQTPRFAYEAHLEDLSTDPPAWPASTRLVSQIRVSIRYRPTGWLSGLTGPATLHLEIVDYPGEWLLDLPLLSLSYEEWSRKVAEDAGRPLRAPLAEPWRRWADALDPAQPFAEAVAQQGADHFKAYLEACREAGLSGLAPGRFLMPGELEGSPALTFSPLPDPPDSPRRGSIAAEMAKRYEAYKSAVVKPFFRDHFARLDRQVVLVDALSAISQGPEALADLGRTLTDVARAFNPGQTSWLGSLFGQRRIDRILFAATKADHIHHSQHPRLEAIMAAMVARSAEAAAFKGAETDTLALAAIRATVEQDVRRDGLDLACVRGRLLETGRETALYPGELPETPGDLLNGGGGWLTEEFSAMRFAPPRLSARQGEGPPHVRLDKAMEFLLGDRLD